MAIQPKVLKILLKKGVCIEGISEDDLRQLVDSLEVEVVDEEIANLVSSTGGIPVKFIFGPDGSFTGAYARQGGKQVPLIPGAGGSGLALFAGAPTASNPGTGWKVEIELTKKYFHQPEDETNWEIFLASRTAVINTL